MKTEFHQFFGFLGRRRPLPLSYRINRGSYQQRAATKRPSGLRFAIGSNYHLHPDGSTELHLAGYVWVDRDHSVHYLPRSFRLLLGGRKGLEDDAHRECHEHDGNTASHKELLPGLSLAAIRSTLKVTTVTGPPGKTAS